MSNERLELIEESNGFKIMVPKQGGHARALRKCHWCKKPTTQYACDECKKKHGWTIRGREES